MPAPASTDDFLAIVEKSRLMALDELDGYRLRAAADPKPPKQVADWMVKDGVLTAFQAELLLAGKSRPFFIGPYKVLSRIGNGSMGVVYLCEHVDMCRRVAVKVLQERRAKDEVAFQRFLREARAAAALNHPNVVHALDLGNEGNVHYLTMEYIDGVSLKDLVRKEGPLPARRLADYLRQAALGVQHAHEVGLVHRDIKPSNIMIDRDGVVKVLDLGLALFADAEEELTRGARLGNIAYAAPEQVQDSHTVDARADIYSLGATFYFAATGRHPTPGVGISNDTPPPRANDKGDFTRLMSILQRMTAPEPANRYQTAAKVVTEMVMWVPPAPPMPSALNSVADPPMAEPVFDETPPPAVVRDDLAFETPPLRNGPAVRVPKRAAKQKRPASKADTPKPTTSKPATSHPPTSEPATNPGWLYRWRWPVVFSAAALVGLLLALVTR